MRNSGDMTRRRAVTIYAGADVAATRRLVGYYCVGEIERLKRTFSPYRSDSEILHLNREGR